MRITAKHPIRRVIGDLPTYHDSKGCIIVAVREACAACDLHVEIPRMSGPAGHAVCTLHPVAIGHYVCTCCAEKMDRAEFDNGISISWYTMESGRVELTVYVT